MQQVTQRPVHNDKSYGQGRHKQHTSERLRHQNLSGNSNAKTRNMVSSSATTRPTAFSALTAAAQPELSSVKITNASTVTERTPRQPLQTLIPVHTLAIRHPCPEAAKPPSRVSYAEWSDSHGFLHIRPPA